MTDKQSLDGSHTSQYGYEMFTAARIAGIKAHEFTSKINCSECVIMPVGVYVEKRQWRLKDITSSDRRLESMMEALAIAYPKTVQRYSWPLIEQGDFPLVCVSPESSGKTYAHLLYSVAKCIAAVPVAKTEALISELETNDIFSPQDIIESQSRTEQSTAVEREKTPEAEIDQENFDFNSLGNKVEEKLTLQSDGQSTRDLKLDEQEVNPDEFITHPKYVIICSSQRQAETVKEIVDEMKAAAYGTKVSSSKRKDLAPKVRIVSAHNPMDKLAIRCNEGEILIGTPGPLIKCLESKYLNFSKCKKVFFDDIDLTIQLYNSKVRELAKYFLAQVGYDEPDSDRCQMVLFTSKWTDLVRQFAATMFPQRILLFRSLVEASHYVGMKFELEILAGPPLEKLIRFLESSSTILSASDKLAIVCKNFDEAKNLFERLKKFFVVKLVPHEDTLDCLKSKRLPCGLEPVYILDDSTIESASDYLNDIKHLIHYSLPEEWCIFDDRFRLLYQSISDSNKNLVTTVYLRKRANIDQIKKLYDVMARSSSTLPSTRLQLRDYMNYQTRYFCWRWATSGVCRLEKLSRQDRFGSFCPHRHSLIADNLKMSSIARWPKSGQFKISITHCVSPNEFYFRFGSHRDIDSERAAWRVLESTGLQSIDRLQTKLNAYRNTPSMSVPLESIKIGKVFGVYFHDEARVDRIMILESLNRQDIKPSSYEHRDSAALAKFRYTLEYGKQIMVEKIDYGVQVSVYLRNIIELSSDLASLPRLSHRGFVVGFKPAQDEPDWSHKATKEFADCVAAGNVREIQVWMRLSNGDAFWFDNMVVINRLKYFTDHNIIETNPYKKLIDDGFAVSVESNLAFLNPSMRTTTLQKWQSDILTAKANYAFLPKDKVIIAIDVLYIEKDLTLYVRNCAYESSLVKLERDLKNDYDDGKLKQQQYLVPDIYCIMKFTDQSGLCTFNRCKILDILTITDEDGLQDSCKTRYEVFCLDHGDIVIVNKPDLYEIDKSYLTRLPFQAIKYKLADLDDDSLYKKDKSLLLKTQNALYDLTRDEKNNLRKVGCSHASNPDYLYLWFPNSENQYESVMSLLERKYELPVFTNENPVMREPLAFNSTEDQEAEQVQDCPVDDRDQLDKSSPNELLESLLRLSIEDLLFDMAKIALSRM